MIDTTFTSDQMRIAAYEALRQDGSHNMASPQVAQILGITREKHRFILRNYVVLKAAEGQQGHGAPPSVVLGPAAAKALQALPPEEPASLAEADAAEDAHILKLAEYFRPYDDGTMNIHPIPLHMFYAKLLQRLGVRQIYVFDIPLHDLNVGREPQKSPEIDSGSPMMGPLFMKIAGAGTSAPPGPQAPPRRVR